MTALVWDQVGERRYETGVDRGVLYIPGGVAWNGLTSVSEDRGREVNEYYLDGYKYLEQYGPHPYSATLQAFTYPDQLEELLGTAQYAPGVFLHQQDSRFFNLSYRTLVANDVSGTDYGYKIHLVYNIRAIPSNPQFSTVASGFNATMFEWALSGLDSYIPGRNPSNHVSLDSRFIPAAKLTNIEHILYGSGSGNPSLPSITDLLALVS